MLRHLSIAIIGICLVTLPANAQTGDSTGATSLTESSPQENARSGSVSLRSPGTWVRGALSRHGELKGLRLTGPRFGQPNTEEAELRFGSSGSSSSSGLGSLGSLLNLAGSLGSGSTGAIGDIGTLLGSLVGGGSGSTSGSTTTGSGSGDVTIPPPSNGTSYTLQDLLALQDAYASQKSINSESDKTSTMQSQDEQTFGGAIGRLPKAEDRFQTTTEEGDSFKVRWANAMLQTMFSAVAVGFQSSPFIDALKDGLRPLFYPPAEETADGDGSGDGDGDGSDGGDSGDGGQSDGGGIEDIDPGDDTTDPGGSVI